MENETRRLQPSEELLASVIITTYNRCDALAETLQALGRQTIAPDQYEILVVDDGSTDATPVVMAETSLPCVLKTFRQPENRGISAGRNAALRHACGRYLILVSDDLIVPQEFIATHVQTLEQFPGWWVVGGFQQLASLTHTPFGRYLDRLEKSFEQARKAEPAGPNLWEMTWPTARNLSLPRADLARTGLFDEQFRSSCEDQDLAHRARDVGIRFLYNANITCLHNDQVGELQRCCRQQERFAHDGALFCAKRPAIHGEAALVRMNGYISGEDSPVIVMRKLVKAVLASGPVTRGIERSITLAERTHLPEPMLYRLYRLVIGLYIFRGWRQGLETLRLGATPVGEQSAAVRVQS